MNNFEIPEVISSLFIQINEWAKGPHDFHA